MKINLNESFEHLYELGEDYSSDEMNNIRPDYIKEAREYKDDGTFVITDIDNEENVNEAFSDKKYFYIIYSDINHVNSQAAVAANDEEDAVNKLFNEYLSDGHDLEIISIEEIDEEEFEGLRSDFNNSPMNNLKVIEESREYKDDGTFIITDIDHNDDTSYEESLNEQIIIPEDFEIAFDEPTPPQQLLDPIKLELVQPENNLPIEQNSREEITNSNDVSFFAAAVMTAYQNANKWLDSVKEVLYTDLSCPFFSSFVHKLAHTMPGRFDKFGDILHTTNMKIPYPATPEISREPSNITEAFDIIFQVLEQIKLALNDFIQATDVTYHGMACSAEACLNDIESEYPMLNRLRDKWNQCNNDMVDFDKYVCQYIDHKDDLLESLNNKNINEAMDTNDVLAKLKNVQPGAFAVKVIYKSPLPVSKRALKAGSVSVNPDECYRITTRLGRIKVRYYNTKFAKDRAAMGAIQTHQPPKGFKGPENEEEQGLLYYSISSNEPYLILQQGNVKNGTSAEYYVDGERVDFAKVQDLVDQGVFTSKAAEPVEDRNYMLIKLASIEDIIVKEKEQDSHESLELHKLTEDHHRESIPIVKYWLDYDGKEIIYGLDTATNALDIILKTLKNNPTFIENYDLLNIGIIYLDIDANKKVDDGDWALWCNPAQDEDDMQIGGDWDDAFKELAKVLNIDLSYYE